MITSVAVEAGQLVAHGLAGTQPFTAPITSVTADPPATPGACPILHLTLGPLDLNLLGLMVHLDQVVLDITAQQGPGQLLGNLLCAVAHLLDGTGLSGVLAQLLTAVTRVLSLTSALG